MELLAGLLVVLIIVVPLILLIVFIGKVNLLTIRVQRLEQELRRLGASTSSSAPEKPPDSSTTPPVVKKPLSPPLPSVAPVVSSIPQATAPSRLFVREKRSRGR